MTRPQRDGAPFAEGFWRKALLRADGATLKQAIGNLTETGLLIGLVVTPDDTLIGTVTDGDIRRGLLRGLDLNGSLMEVVNCQPIVVPPDVRDETARQIMQVNRIHQLPIVDESHRVVGLHIWDELMAPRRRPDNLVVIMAGGQGSRLRPHTEQCPKPLLPVAGKPMLEHIIERARAEGFERFVLAVHFLGHMIEDYFGDGSRWQVQIDYVRETSPLGTAGAISLLVPRPDAPFVVTNGDVLTDIRYGELLDFHSQHAAEATMAVRLHEWQHPFGVVLTSGVDVIGFEEKPVSRSRINAGVYVLEPSALDLLNPQEPCDMPMLFSRLRDRSRRTIAYPVHEHWIDIGQPKDYVQANGVGEASRAGVE